MKEFIYGINPVIEVIRANKRKIYTLFISENKKSLKNKKLIEYAKNRDIPIKYMYKQQFKDYNHQGVVIEVSSYKYKSLEFVISATKRERFILLLDKIMDPYNLGAIIRTSLLMGFKNIAITKHHSLGINSTVCKTSSGAVEYVNITLVNSITQLILDLKKEGFFICVTDTKGQDIHNVDFKSNIALVLGNEGKGVRPIVKKKADILVSIPQSKILDSYNVSVANGIILYEIFRQRI